MLGFTGHQHLGSKTTTAWVRRQIRTAVINHTPDYGITSLAVGADQLFADVLMELGTALQVIVPCKRYEKTFDTAGLAKYRYFMRLAAQIDTLEFEEPSEAAYYEAGKVIVNRSEVLLAVWDGKPARGLGGTADVVKYAQERHKPVIHINPEQGTYQVL